ncbi:hypothetical protein KSZ_62610 [Dictyobacter formicarum]|uniref:LIM zinc-binding domain-containing protein n=1 Tax=Dictyobacter formicarum TaxID=2778368 RepID=A0ABQ3VQ58_9CHLR|nr:hypothetical protein KSZ_61410 [Dictyobacter formicarum]GHO88255.1 hypothetical protein KSZ_62610 [Dictyobacter formicarum]
MDGYVEATCDHCQQKYNKMDYAADIRNGKIVSYDPHCFFCFSCETWKNGHEIAGYAAGNGRYCNDCERIDHLSTKLS